MDIFDNLFISVSLAWKYFMYFLRICCYFFVARELQTREVLLDICDDLRARGSPLNGAAFLPLFTLLVTAIVHC
jgi:hypothetical protein